MVTLFLGKVANFSTEEREQLLMEVLKLPELQKNVIVKHYFHQQSLENVCAILDISSSHFHQLHQAALKRLKNWED